MPILRLDDVLAEVMELIQVDDFVSAAVRLRRGLDRDGETHRELWMESMLTERRFFADDATRGRADLRVNGDPGIAHDPESEIVLLD